MSEVHKNIPSTVVKAGVTGKKKEKMLQAIAFSKAGMSKKKKFRQTSDGRMKA
jgi:hypothetical protein